MTREYGALTYAIATAHASVSFTTVPLIHMFHKTQNPTVRSEESRIKYSEIGEKISKILPSK